MSVLEGIEMHCVVVPMRRRFRRVDARPAVLLRGPGGWGEFSPFLEYPPSRTRRWLRAALEAATIPWPDPVRSAVPVNVTVPAVAPEEAARIVLDSGCATAKVKVAEPGRGFAEDLARVAAVREALGPAGRLRIDVNGAWTVTEAEERLARLAPYDLEYVEQPCADAAELAEVRRRVSVPVAADESVRFADDPVRIVEQGAADLLVLKVQPLGGIARVLDVARRAGVPVVVSSALETSVGLAAGVAAAASLPELPYACGLATALLLADDVTDVSLVPDQGSMTPRRVVPTAEALARLRPPPSEEAAMLRRLEEAARLLEAM